jgi:hypothetical protein
MKKIITVLVALSMFLLVAFAQAHTICVGYEDTVVIFFDKDNNGVYELIKLCKANEPIKVITLEEANQIVATFPKNN